MGMGMPEVTDGHRRLARMEGDWIGEERMHPSKWVPDGGLAIGRQTWKVGPGSFFLIGDVEQERDGIIVYSGHGVWEYKAEADLYRLHWFESSGTPPELFEGNFEGDVLDVSNATGTHARLRTDLSEPDVLRTQFLMAGEGEDWRPFMDGTYRRA
jgi:hypothetical protein